MVETLSAFQARLEETRKSYRISGRPPLTKAKVKNMKKYLSAIRKLIKLKEEKRLPGQGITAAKKAEAEVVAKIEVAEAQLAGKKAEKPQSAKKVSDEIKAIAEQIKSGNPVEGYVLVPKGKAAGNHLVDFIAEYGDHDVCKRK